MTDSTFDNMHLENDIKSLIIIESGETSKILLIVIDNIRYN